MNVIKLSLNRYRHFVSTYEKKKKWHRHVSKKIKKQDYFF
jgi:hypothetical protein